MKSAFALLALTTAAALATACTPGLRVKSIEAGEEKPANVLLFFRVESEGQAVASLDESAFTVKEDEHLIGAGPDRVIVNPDLRTQQATVLLIDLGGRASPEELDAIAAAAGVVVDRLGASRRLAIWAVDGAEQPSPLAPMGSSLDALKAAAAKIPQYKTRDPSLDLNGGYLAALRALKTALAATNGANGLKLGNVLVIARGPDRASRATALQVNDEVKKVTIDLGRYAIAFGGAAPTTRLAEFSDTPWYVAPTADSLLDAATRAAEAIDQRGRSYYLLSYCSPARAGEHTVKLEVVRERDGSNGRKEVQRGSLAHTFRADGFGPGCTPNVPSFK